MTYQDIGHLFFPIYLVASVCACALSMGRGWRRHLWTSFVFGVYVILLFQLHFDGAAHELGRAWYGVVAFTQLVMGVVAYMLKVRGWKVITVAAAVAMAIQAVYLAFSLMDQALPRQGYFVTVNLVQCLQVGSLIVCAPVWPFLAGLKGMSFTRRRTPWKLDPPSQQRTAISGTR